MLHALNERGDKIKATKSGAIAKCQCCGNDVRAYCGRKKIHHWKHVSKIECDSWYEGMSEWHTKWQNLFPEKNNEVVMFDQKTGEKHIADVKCDNGLVVEFQHSPIKIEEIESRETFYGQDKKKMIWVLDGGSLCAKSELGDRYKTLSKKDSFLRIWANVVVEANYKHSNDEIDGYIHREKRKQYAIDLLYKIRDELWGKDYVDWKSVALYCSTELTNYPFGKSGVVVNEDNVIDIKNIVSRLNNEKKDRWYFETVKLTFKQLDNTEKTWHRKIYEEVYVGKKINKKYWRSFIDEMKAPVFIDNLTGLGEDELYYYQENKIIKKTAFLKRSLSYCNAEAALI